MGQKYTLPPRNAERTMPPPHCGHASSRVFADGRVPAERPAVVELGEELVLRGAEGAGVEEPDARAVDEGEAPVVRLDLDVAGEGLGTRDPLAGQARPVRGRVPGVDSEAVRAGPGDGRDSLAADECLAGPAARVAASGISSMVSRLGAWARGGALLVWWRRPDPGPDTSKGRPGLLRDGL
ncbi:hypothetical protein [Xylanimonas protaetiae]|uniref:hypothetical protein n=1 Tax=Xylanimonas protaetiae TaxID=2509457 RepID=UPI001F5C685A|nr:hypothetical protein [Xylanimonas protaetiae]